MYNIADKMITGCKFDFAIFAILTLQIPIACFDMVRVSMTGKWLLEQRKHGFHTFVVWS